MALADAPGLPLALDLHRATPHEVPLVESVIDKRFIGPVPTRIIGDKASDSDPLDAQVRDRYGLELIAPHRSNRKAPKTQDGRPLRRARRRWKVERLFAWLHNFRRLVVRHEYSPPNFLAMLHLACALILMRSF